MSLEVLAVYGLDYLEFFTFILLEVILDSDFRFITTLWPDVILVFGTCIFSVLYCWIPKLAREPNIPPMIYGYKIGTEPRFKA